MSSWKRTISTMASSAIRLSSSLPILPTLSARAAFSRLSGRTKLPICSARNGGFSLRVKSMLSPVTNPLRSKQMPAAVALVNAL
jgi:hypothetical protein